MVFLLVVLLSSAVWGYAVGLMSAVMADVLLNVFFVPPLHRPTVQDPHNIAALVVFLCVAGVGASMLALLRGQVAAADARRAELATMLELSRRVAGAPGPRFALHALVQSVARALDAGRCELWRNTGKQWEVIASAGNPGPMTRDELSLANRAVETGQIVRTLDDSRRLRRASFQVRGVTRDVFVPFRPGPGDAGVLRVAGALTAPAGGDLDGLLRAFADEAGLAVQRLRLEEEARRAEAIKRADEFKSILLSSVSHDLRSPLTAIKAAVGSLLSEGLEWGEDDRRQLLATIESQTDRLTATVEELLDMSRLEAGAVSVQAEPVHVRALLDEAARGTASATANRSVRVDAGDELWVRADYGLMLRALCNLVENAAKYSVQSGTISISGEASGGRCVLSVTDEGPGIAPDDLPYIFDKFYRGRSSRGTTGSGLGLAIVRAMVQLNRGSISVDSTPAGTTFRINLPLAAEPR